MVYHPERPASPVPHQSQKDLLDQLRAAYAAHPDLTGFAPFPTRLVPQEIAPQHRAPSDLMRADPGLASSAFPGLTAAIQAAAPQMRWRETYPEDAEGADFMDRWGCFTIIGADSPFASPELRVFVVYMPARLVYPSHRHPAEEIYLVLAGRARFRREGQRAQTLSPGQTVFHASNQVHAIETGERPVLCLVAWRSHLETPPVLVLDQRASLTR
jgi:quercetin dioxygenase-like cupin family protein